MNGFDIFLREFGKQLGITNAQDLQDFQNKMRQTHAIYISDNGTLVVNLSLLIKLGINFGNKSINEIKDLIVKALKDAGIISAVNRIDIDVDGKITAYQKNAKSDELNLKKQVQNELIHKKLKEANEIDKKENKPSTLTGIFGLTNSDAQDEKIIKISSGRKDRQEVIKEEKAPEPSLNEKLEAAHKETTAERALRRLKMANEILEQNEKDESDKDIGFGF